MIVTQAGVFQNPPELLISSWRSAGAGEFTEMTEMPQQHRLPEPTRQAADELLQFLGMRRTDAWLHQSGAQAPRLLFVANVQRLPQWLSKADHQPG